MTLTETTGVRPSRASSYFFGAVLIVCVWYTRIAFTMPTSTKSSVIGPGFFPRYIGAIACILCAIALLRELLALAGSDRFTYTADADAAEKVDRYFWFDFWIVIGVAAVALGALFEVLGAVIATVIFTTLVMAVINRGRWVANATIAIGLAVVLHLLFDVLLDSGMPQGILPL